MPNPPQNLTRDQFIQAVDHVIRERKTAKILGNIEDYGDTLSTPARQAINQQIAEAIAVAGWAPFHKLVDKQHLSEASQSPVPWRFYVLDKPAAGQVLEFIKRTAETSTDPKWARTLQKKIPKLLAGADALVLVTWLPDSTASGQPELTTNNIEHIAASSAAVQNLLLAAEARGFYTYWSSGGVLRDVETFEFLAIPTNQQLLGAIFLVSAEHTPLAPSDGANREKRGTDWVTWLNSDTA